MIYVVQTYIIPVLAIITPALLVLRKKGDAKLDIYRPARLIIITFFFMMMILTLLIYLSGGLNYLYYNVASKPKIVDKSLQWDITRHYQLLIPLYLFNNLLSISFISGIIYASLIVLPKTCEVDLKESAASNFTAGVSAIGSGVVCCSTSILAIISPGFVALIGPFAPGLLVISLGLLLYSFNRVVIPRIALISVYLDS